MGIQALPSATVRTIGASQVLHDASEVVKELLDNGLDAHAISIAIEISSNTLDSIQVRDNGHGIPAIDRNLVARPHCTSKISNERDVRLIGGSSLGFRGEALASVAELSGSLTISTRVEGEQVATALKINQRGEVDSQERASLPVGTTVKVTEFMKSNPVRKQVALKSAEKTLMKIKHMLQSYAFARPSVRILFRVLKAKNESFNWVYAPKPGSNAEDVVLKVARTHCASQCTWSIVEDHGFTMQAFLPKPDADASKVSNLGCFFSVDSRPVSASRGVPKQVAKIFRERLRKSNASFSNVKDPFIYLQLSCPPATYDANVEPAKDDVLFEDPDIILSLARRLFDTVYQANETTDTPKEPEVGITHSQKTPQAGPSHTLSPATQAALNELSNDVEFENLEIDHDHFKDSTDPLPHLSGSTRSMDAPQPPFKVFRSNMYGCDEEDLDFVDARPPTGRTEADFEELRQARKDVNLSNPWVIAKLNAPTRRAAQSQKESKEDEVDYTASDAVIRPSMSTAQSPIDLEMSGLPTPGPSSPTPRSSFHPSDHVPLSRIARDGRLIGPQALPPPEQVLGPRSSQASFDDDMPRQVFRQTPMYDYTLSSHTSEGESGLALRDIPNTSRTRHPRADHEQPSDRRNNPPFKPPGGYQEWQKPRAPKQRGRNDPRPPRDVAGLVVQGELGDLVEDPRPLTPPMRNRDMRDFVTSLELTGDNSVASMIESRNYSSKRRSKSLDSRADSLDENGGENRAGASGMLSGSGFVPVSELAALEARTGLLNKDRTVPVKRRKTSVCYALAEISPTEESVIQHQADDDVSRHIDRSVSRRRSTTGGNKSRRTKSSQLPLERTPTGQAVQNVVLTVTTSGQAVARLAGKIDEEGSIATWKQRTGELCGAFTPKPNTEMVSQMTTGLRELLISRVSDGEMVQNLGQLVRMHLPRIYVP